MYPLFFLVLILLSVAIFVMRTAFPIPFVARHCYWWGGSLLTVFVLFQLWFWLRPSPVPFSANEAAAVRDAVVQAIEKAEKAEGFVPGATAAVVHLVSDPTDEATAVLRREVAGRDGWTLVDGSPAVAFVKSLAKTLYDATSADEYLRPGARVGIDVVFYGRLNNVSTEGGVSRASLSLAAYDTRCGAYVFKDDVSGAYPRVHTAVGRAVVAKSRSSRLWIFAVAVLALPWVFAPLSARAFARRSNSASAAVLAALVVADAALGLALFYGVSAHAVASLGVIALCTVYDLAACEIVSRKSAAR